MNFALQATRFPSPRLAGLQRRLERVGRWRAGIWYDDDAQCPAEVAAALAALRQMFPSREIWCIFQPHQVSRTWRLLDDFAASLQNADRVAIGQVFSGREAAGPAGAQLADVLAERTRSLGAEVLEDHALERLAEEIGDRIAPGDVLLTLGAGDIREVWNGITGRIRTDRAAA